MRRPYYFLSLLAVSLAAVHCEDDAVAPTAVASVRVTPAAATIAVGETATFTAEALDASNAVLTGKAFTFYPLDQGVATVANTQANPATFRAVAAGSTTIRADCEGKIGEANLTVQAMSDLQVRGRVIDGETGAPIASAQIEFEGSHNSSAQAVSGADGAFSFALHRSTSRLTVTARSSGYVPATLRLDGGINYPSQQIETIPLVRETGMTGGISGTTRNAVNNLGIQGRVELHSGVGFGSVLPTPVAMTSTDAAGNFSFATLPAGTYSMTAAADGFFNGFRTGIAVGNGGLTPNQDVTLSPSTGGLRVVLTWGESPRDLDSHLTVPNPSGAERFHVYYANRLFSDSPPYAGLDLDDTNGVGPETITISQLNAGTYRYSVHDYSNRRSTTSTALGSSSAKVELYVPGRTYTYYVSSGPGTLWTVFELSGDINNPTVTLRNTMGFAEDADGIPKAGFAGNRETDAQVIEAATAVSKP